MAFYPFYESLRIASMNMQKGNFGLWYNKFIPLNEGNFKASDEKGVDKAPVEHYERRYGQMKDNASELLKRKHLGMSAYCENFSKNTYEIIDIKATLKTPLITGIGESHPHEVSMVFDHNLGIPYIPASGVKGIVRFAHTLSIFLDENGQIREEFRDKEFFEEIDTDIPDIFGGEKKAAREKNKKDLIRGKVVFLDAYPEKTPDLKVDIMNPHYGDYYSDDKGKTPPADYLSPVPIKFLTVLPGTVFVFRAIAEIIDDLPQKVRSAFKKALKEEGVGAKTAIGYGRFAIRAADVKNNISLKSPSKDTPFADAHMEAWEEAYVSYDAGGGGTLKATAKDGKKKAELRGTEKAKAVTDAALHKTLFEKPKNVPKAHVTVRKVGNSYEIVRVRNMA